jgi:membrane protease YdiL (CAAX protease family)
MIGSPTPAPERSNTAASWREVFGVYAISAALTAVVVGLGAVVPFLAQNGLVLVAAIFLILPTLALRRRGLEPADYGLNLDRFGRGVKLGLLLTAVTLVPFWVGFHIWEAGILGHRLDVDADNYRAWPESLRVEPDVSAEGFYLWRYQSRLVASWVGEGPWTLRVETDGRLVHRAGPVPTLTDGDESNPDEPDVGATQRWVIDGGPSPSRLVFWARDADWLRLGVERRGQPVPPEDIRLGVEPAESNPVRLGRSLWWIPQALLIQLLMVALPEEFFYRGYIQGRLNELSTRRWRLGPFHTSPPILVTSALFALGHFVVGLDAQRLAVFFPSLLFGWLRDRTGGLVAPVIYHAACNLMVELTVVHYWPA